MLYTIYYLYSPNEIESTGVVGGHFALGHDAGLTLYMYTHIDGEIDIDRKIDRHR